MNRRFTAQGLMGMMLSPEMRGMAIYRSGRAALRGPDGHPGGPGADDDDTGEDTDDDEDQDDDEDEDSDSDDDTDSKSRKKKSKGDDPDDEDESVPAWRHDKIVARLAAADKAKGELQKQLDALKANGVKDEDVKREMADVQASVAKTQADNVALRMKVAFLSTKVKGIEWNDPADAMALMDFASLDPEDGKIDPRAMRSAIKALAKAKPYLLAKTQDAADDDATDSTEERPARTGGRPVNPRRGKRPAKPSADDIMKQFPGVFSR